MNKKESEQAADPHGFREEGQDLLRGIAGGAIVGVPPLCTSAGGSLREDRARGVLAGDGIPSSGFALARRQPQNEHPASY
jgi:hypothetical protein